MSDELDKVVVGRIISIDPHPDADRLVVCKTDVGEGEPLQIVCGAKNMKPGDRVPTAMIGGKLPGFAITKRKMRGVESQGMMCSAKELGLGEDHAGLMILDDSFDIGADAIAALGLDDTVLEIEITPNRGDWAGMIGIARELAAHMNAPLTLPGATVAETSESAADVSSVKIEAPDLCPRYAGRVVRNVTVEKSPAWLCQRLIAAGQRPINNIVDITNYVLLETGHPLHGFDFNLLKENRIVVRRAKDGEVIKTIDEQDRKLDADMLVIADAKNPVAIAGVMGGHDSEVGEKTTDVFLESAYFLPASIRRTSRTLNLSTEASTRFQRGADPEMVVYAANRASKLMAEVAGARVLAGVLDEYPGKTSPRKVTLRFERTNALLGAGIKAEQQRKILSGLGFEEESASPDEINVKVPPRRHDVSHEADLIEEIARLHGFNNIPVTLPRVRPCEEVLAPDAKAQRRLRQFLVGIGLTELSNLTFSSMEALQQATLSIDESNLVNLQNPLSERLAIMRPSLIPAMLETVSLNERHGTPNMRLFEIGPTFVDNPNADLAVETPHLSVVLTGNRSEPTWESPAEPVNFYDLKGIVEAAIQFLGHQPSFAHAPAAPFATEAGAEITVNNEVVGYLGLVDDRVGKNFQIDAPVYLADINLLPLLGAIAEPQAFQAIPKFPPALLDLAVVVAHDVPAEAIRLTAEKAGGKRLKYASIFDVYTGEQVESGKKSVALKLVFQLPDRTLKDKETAKDCAKIQEALAHEFNATIR